MDLTNGCFAVSLYSMGLYPECDTLKEKTGPKGWGLSASDRFGPGDAAGQAFTIRNPPAYAVSKAIKKAGSTMNELLAERTPPVIAAEINRIKEETSMIMLAGALEIGRRLKEAKDLLPHGEWGKWLVESVNYSQRTANRLMQLFEEYGDKLFTAGAGDGSNSSAPTNLTYYQAVLLLGIPEDEREQFILEHDVKNMTTRELGQALKERKQTSPENEQAPVTPLPDNPGEITIEYQTVKKTNQSKSRPQTAASQAFTAKYEERCLACRQIIANTFQELLEALGQLARLDPAVKEKCSQEASQLAEYMVERLKEWPPVATTNMKTVKTYAPHERW